MSKSLSFDRAASIYDQTRPLLEPIAKQGIQAILDIIEQDAHVLDVGTGTGRISVPLLQRGVDLIGCDISSKMLSRLKDKFPAARIALADASLLPFLTGKFDVVLTVHVLHLIPPWREALREFRRVLKPHGVYLNVKTWESAEISVREQIRTHWRNWLETQGVKVQHVGLHKKTEFLQEVSTLGGNLTEVEVVRYPMPFTLREELDRLASRTSSDTWAIPDDIFDLSLEELRMWVEDEFKDLNQEIENEVRFVIEMVRF